MSVRLLHGRLIAARTQYGPTPQMANLRAAIVRCEPDSQPSTAPPVDRDPSAAQVRTATFCTGAPCPGRPQHYNLHRRTDDLTFL